VTHAPLETLLRRDRAVVLAALAAVALVAWVYLAWTSAHQSSAGGMIGMDMASPELGGWSAADVLLTFLMWAIMMIGMMTPSVAPMLLIYARVARHANERAQPFASTGWFAAGYLLAWVIFAAAATLLQWLLNQAALMTPAMALASEPLGGALLVAAGLYQWTPFKDACLGQCRSPFQFIQSRGGFRSDRGGSIRLGLEHGAFCIGCCWALMLLLFLVGVMNLLWIAALAALVLVEKAFRGGRYVARATGIMFIVAGSALII
jgi:predicted metal-binding membrane protein